MSSVGEAVEELCYAVEVEGPLPKLHRKTMAKHREEWPRLWQAIDAVIAASKENEFWQAIDARVDSIGFQRAMDEVATQAARKFARAKEQQLLDSIRTKEN